MKVAQPQIPPKKRIVPARAWRPAFAKLWQVKKEGVGGNSEQAALRADHIFASEPDFDFWRGTIYEVITFF